MNARAHRRWRNTQRVTTLARGKRMLFRYACAVVSHPFGERRPIPKATGGTIVFRRYPFAADAA